jgi:hypothetical protein
MERRTVVLIVAAFALAGLVGGGAALFAADDEPVTASTTAVAPATTTSAADPAKAKDNFLKLLRDQGVVKGPADEQLAYPEGDMYCRYLAEGLTTQKLMDTAGTAGSPERAKSERVLSAAVATLCPQHAPKLMPPASQP